MIRTASKSPAAANARRFEAKHILLAPGTRPARPTHIPFNGETVFDSDEILNLSKMPRSMIVVGGGVIGLEYAIMFATLGVQVTVVDGRCQLLEFCDHEIIDTLLHHARSQGMLFRLGESVIDIHEPKSLSQNRRGLAHFAESSEQNVPVPLSADGSGIGSKTLRS